MKKKDNIYILFMKVFKDYSCIDKWTDHIESGTCKTYKYLNSNTERHEININ